MSKLDTTSQLLVGYSHPVSDPDSGWKKNGYWYYSTITMEPHTYR